MIDEKRLVEQLNELKDKCWDRAKKENNINFARKQLDISQVIGIINIQPKIGGWIPCSERLPDKDGEYICTQKIYNLSNGKLSGKSIELVEFYNGKWMRAKHLKVIAWQPFPEEYHE